MLARRIALAARYTRAFAQIPGLEPPEVPSYTRPNYQSYAVRVTAEFPLGRDELMQSLLEQGISTRRGIMNAHQEGAYAEGRPAPASLGGGQGRGGPAAALRLLTRGRPGLRHRGLRDVAAVWTQGRRDEPDARDPGDRGTRYDILDIVEAINVAGRPGTWSGSSTMSDCPGPGIWAWRSSARCTRRRGSGTMPSSTRSAATRVSGDCPRSWRRRAGRGTFRDPGAPRRLGLARAKIGRDVVVNHGVPSAAEPPSATTSSCARAASGHDVVIEDFMISFCCNNYQTLLRSTSASHAISGRFCCSRERPHRRGALVGMGVVVVGDVPLKMVGVGNPGRALQRTASRADS